MPLYFGPAILGRLVNRFRDRLECCLDQRLAGIWVSMGFFVLRTSMLRPCIDYWGPTEITTRNKYPLPLLEDAFAALHWVCIFTKLDLRNAYHLVCIRLGDEWKTAFKHSSRPL